MATNTSKISFEGVLNSGSSMCLHVIKHVIDGEQVMKKVKNLDNIFVGGEMKEQIEKAMKVLKKVKNLDNIKDFADRNKVPKKKRMSLNPPPPNVSMYLGYKDTDGKITLEKAFKLSLDNDRDSDCCCCCF